MSKPRGGLGRGLAALIPTGPDTTTVSDVLLNGGIDGWPLWTWLTSPTSFLSGQTPESVARTAPERAMTAATRFAVPPAA